MENKKDIDDLLYDLTNDIYNDTTVKQFEKAVNDAVEGVKESFNTTISASTSGAYRSNRSTQAKTYKTIKPHVVSSYQNDYYPSRYLHVTTCLKHINYDNYDAAKAEGHMQAVKAYLEMIENNAYDLRPVEAQIKADIKTLKAQIASPTAGNVSYLNGLYDGTLLVQSVINNSRLQRLQELSSMV